MIDGLLGRPDLHVRAERLLTAHRAADPIAALVIEAGPLTRLRTARHSPSLGERLTRRIAVIRDELREPLDILARYDERRLVAILSRTSLTEAVAVGERIRRAVEVTDARDTLTRGGGLAVTIGAAALPAATLVHLDDLMNAAEAARRAAGAGDRIGRAAARIVAATDDVAWA